LTLTIIPLTKDKPEYFLSVQKVAVDKRKCRRLFFDAEQMTGFEFKLLIIKNLSKEKNETFLQPVTSFDKRRKQGGFPFLAALLSRIII